MKTSTRGKKILERLGVARSLRQFELSALHPKMFFKVKCKINISVYVFSPFKNKENEGFTFFENEDD